MLKNSPVGLPEATRIALFSRAMGLLTPVIFLGVAVSATAQPIRDGDTQNIIAADKAIKRGDCANALKIIRPLAERGDARGEHLLGNLYLGPTHCGLPLSYPNGAKWFKLAADQGDAFAQNTVGGLYDRGRGFPHSPENAVKYYRLSASQGNDGGQYSMCLMYYLGEVVKKDYVQAYMWCSLAVTNAPNYLLADDLVGMNRVAEKLSPAEIIEAKRRAQAWRPVDLRKGKTICTDAACNLPGEGLLEP